VKRLVPLRSECTSITTECRSSTAAESGTVAAAVECFVGNGKVGCATYKWKLSRPAFLPVVFKLTIHMAAAESQDRVGSSNGPEGASGGSSSRLFAFLRHSGTACGRLPKGAGGRGRDRQSEWRRKNAGPQDSKSIRRRRRSRPSGVRGSSRVPRLPHRFDDQT